METEYEIEGVLFDAATISQRLDTIARGINGEYADKELVVIIVLKGAFIFAADLIRRLTIRTGLDFIELASYFEETETSGEILLIKDITVDVTAREVLVIEDIVDTGLTTNFLVDHIRKKGPASVSVCTLLHKPSRQRVDVPLAYIGFEVEDVFAAGYGLDYANKFRNLPDIVKLKSVG